MNDAAGFKALPHSFIMLHLGTNYGGWHIFEDDCEILDPSFVSYIEEKKALYDVIFIGVNSLGVDINKRVCSYGTHAMWISRKALNTFIQHFPKAKAKAIDNIWNELEHIYKLKYFRPKDNNRFVKQKEGLISYITGKPRITPGH